MESAETMEVKKNQSGIGGWLAFFILGLFVSGAILSFESLNLPLDASNALPMLMGLSLAVLAFSAAVLLLRTNPRGILLAKVFIGTNLLVHSLAIVGSLGDARAVGAASADMGRVLLFSLIWITYLQQSMRVKNTFGLRSERVDRATGSQEVPRIAETTGKDGPVLEETQQHDIRQDQSVVRQTAQKTVSRKTTFRRIAREAVIFMLIGLALSSVGAFIKVPRTDAGHSETTQLAQDEMRRVGSSSCRRSGQLVEADGQPGTQRSVCQPSRVQLRVRRESISASIVRPRSRSIRRESPTRPRRNGDSQGHQEYQRRLFGVAAVLGIVCGAYGFLGSFGAWLFYRLIRFAVKG